MNFPGLLLRAAGQFPGFGESPDRAGNVGRGSCPGTYADANHATQLPLGATDPAFPRLLNVFYRCIGHPVGFSGNQYLVKDDIVENFKTLLFEFPGKLTGASV